MRVIGNDIDLGVAHITLKEDDDPKKFAEKAYHVGSSSFRRLQLPGYRIVVVDGNDRHSFDLAEFRR